MSIEEMIERISRHEAVCDRAADAVAQLRAAAENYLEQQRELDELERYYGSAEWFSDRDADSAGRLPSGLKRGVLSEDAVYDLLCERSRLRELLEQILEGERR